MDRDQIVAEINALHQLLTNSDYKSAQIIESLISTLQDANALNFVSRFISWLASAVREYGEIIRNRAEWRQRLRDMEEALETMEIEE